MMVNKHGFQIFTISSDKRLVKIYLFKKEITSERLLVLIQSSISQ